MVTTRASAIRDVTELLSLNGGEEIEITDVVHYTGVLDMGSTSSGGTN